MPVEDMKAQQAWETADMIRSAADLVANAMRAEDKESQKALRNAAKALLKAAIGRMDESIGPEEDDE